MLLKKYKEFTPKIDGAYVAEDVSVIGDVEIGENASIWYGVVLRGDVDKIKIGANCVVGHNAIIHSCVVEEGCLIGMGSILLDGCHIGAGSIVAAGAVVSPNTVIPPHSMVMGVPGRVVRQLTEKDTEGITLSVGHYIAYAQEQLPKYHI